MSQYNTLLCIPRYWPAIGGSELHTRELSHHLAPYANVTVLSHNSDTTLSNEQACANARSVKYQDQHVQVHQIAPNEWRRPLLQAAAWMHPYTRLVRPLYDRLFAPVSLQALRQLSQGKDLVHAIYNGMTCVAEQALRVAREQEIPFIFTPLAHTYGAEGKGWSSNRFRQLYRQANAVIAMTPYERDWLIQHGAHPSRTHVCPVGPLLAKDIDPDGFRLARGIDQAPLIVFLGRHVKSKGYQQLACAANQVWKKYPEARFLFIGPQTKDSQQFFNTVCDPRIILIEHSTDSEKCSALAACDLLCVPSTLESLGVIYLEAWHYGKPVIAANIDVMRSVIRNGKDGILISPEPSSIAAAINKLLAKPKLRAQLGQSGHARTQHSYAWPRLAAKLAKIYAKALKKPISI